ncbi:MAG: hypothetical protein MUF22_02390 [Chitinispirillaceae bacterium]|jgi:lipopolysaccharide assembly outer membrane protein LptD (OstA)|nr:hypothetical protein [Chitinispirillaceae bacterium]
MSALDATLTKILVLMLLAATQSSGQPDIAAAGDSLVSKKSPALADTVRYKADRIDYDAERRVLTLLGAARIAYQNMEMVADTIVYTMNDDRFTASGKPMIIEGKDTTLGDHMAYNIKTRRGRVNYASTYLADAFLTGQKIVKSKGNNLYVSQGEYTTCAVIDTPHFFFYGENIRIIPGEKIICKPVVLNIGGSPVFALPYFIFPVERDRKSGILTPAWGGNPSGGGYLDNVGYYWTPSDYVDVTAAARVREFSEFVLRGESHYALKYRLSGQIAGRYVLNSDFLKSSREWALDYSHNQSITPDGKTTLSGRGNLVSTKNFYSKFSQESDEIREQLLTANLSLARTFDRIRGSGSVVWNRSQNLARDHTTDDLPSMSFSLFDRPLIPPPDPPQAGESGEESSDSVTSHWYNSIYWGYSGKGIVRSDSWGDKKLKSFVRPGGSNEVHVSSPQKILRHITVSPNFSANLSSFYGYIDTTVKGYDTLFDTTIFTTSNLGDTAKYTNHLMSIMSVDYVPSSDTTDTVYTIREVSKTPVVTPRRDTIDNRFANTGTWRAGVSMSTNLYGLYPVRLFSFAGMRHTLSPSVSYNFLPKHDLNKLFYPVGIGAEGAHEQQQNISFSIGNLFEGKMSPAKKDSAAKDRKFTLLQTDFSTAYNYDNSRESWKWSDLSMNASTGYRFLGVRYSSAFWLYDEAQQLTMPIMRSYSVSLSTGNFAASGKLWDGDKLLLDSLRLADPIRDANAGPQTWRITIMPAYSFSASRLTQRDVFVPQKNYNLSASADLGFTRNWKVSWSGNYNFVADQMVQNSISLLCDLECWAMRFQWRPEKLNPGYYFIINVKKIPEIKWEQRDRF